MERVDTEADGIMAPGPEPDTAWLCLPLGEPIRDDDGRMTWVEPSAVNMKFLATGRCPLLVDHAHTVHSLAGIITSAWLDGATIYAVARFAPTQIGREVRDLVQARIAQNISAGAWTRYGDADGAGNRPIVDYRPYELSVVTVPKNWSGRIAPGPIPVDVRDAARQSAASKASGTRSSWSAFAGDLCGRLPPDSAAMVRTAFDGELARLSTEAASRWGAARQSG